MKTIYPKKLSKGDQIQVIAPSSSLTSMKASVKKRAIQRVSRILGLSVSFGAHTSEKDMFGSSPLQSRLKDLHAAFANTHVKGVACVRGGYNANTLLPYIDWELIQKNPKPFWGYSDITVLANAIYAKTGLMTYSGPNFASFGLDSEKGIPDYIFDYFEKCLFHETAFEITASQYSGERNVAPTKNKGFVLLQEGTAEGTVIGGNLCSLNLLQGTEYMPSIKDKILFLEDDDFGGKETPIEFERNLESLLQLPHADTIRAIVFGRFQKGATMTMQKLAFMLSSKRISKNIPIIAHVDFGHTNPMITFPIGGTVRIQARGKNIKIEIVRH